MKDRVVSKAYGALQTIGEVSTETGIAVHILRYWERNVPELQPLRRAGSRRLYRAADVELVKALQRLVGQEGYTLDGAARSMRAAHIRVGTTEPPVAAAIAASDAVGSATDAFGLMQIRERLSRALAIGL